MDKIAMCGDKLLKRIVIIKNSTLYVQFMLMKKILA